MEKVMKALKAALLFAVTGVALSFASQAKANNDCHPIMLAFWSANSPYQPGMAPLFDEKCNFVKYIAVSGNVSFVAPMPNAATTTIPVTTLAPKNKIDTPKLKSKDTRPAPVIGAPIAQVIQPVIQKTITTTTTSIPTITKNQKETTVFGLKETEFFIILVLFILASIYVITAQMNRSKMAIMRFELERKEKEFNFESKSYELRELAKAKINNEHEVALKTIETKNVVSQLEFTEQQLQNERSHNLEQQRINSSSADKMLSYIMPIVGGRDQHELRMAEIAAGSGLGSILPHTITNATVKLHTKD